MSSPSRTKERGSSDRIDPYQTAQEYYGNVANHIANPHIRTQTFSAYDGLSTAGVIQAQSDPREPPKRRGSHDEKSQLPRKFYIRVDSTLEQLQKQEDTDGNAQITIEDKGPKVMALRTAASNGFNQFAVRGTYMLSNLLQELYLAKSYGRDQILLDEARLNENPINRLSRNIKDTFWANLTRRQDGANIEKAARDPKDWTSDPRPRIYIPRGAPEQFEYYTKIAREQPNMRLDVQWLPDPITPESVRDLSSKPGLLALAMEEITDEKTGQKTMRGLKFIVPGGRFNELYGWDSYMETLGLLINGKVEEAKSMVVHFCFCIEHYGKILNANRSYYLNRSQPPFLTDMTLRVFERIRGEPDAKHFLRMGILAAIKEYHSVWMAEPRLDPVTGLSRYRPAGLGIPPETEPSHFTHILQPFADKHQVPFQEFVEKYNSGEIHEPALDEYLLHDRAVRESGHDTSYRLEGVCANLATIDLNSLLYKYETDIARAIQLLFDDSLEVPAQFCVGTMIPGQVEKSAPWERRARSRKHAMKKYLWNEAEGMYFDYDTVKKEQCTYESATTFWALWAGICTPKQADAMVNKALPKLEAYGGLLSGTEKSRGVIGLDRPNRQWDYPYGWAPQQILAWVGLQRYRYDEIAQRLAYKWLFMISKAFVDFNGVVVEKYDVTRPSDPHRVDAEYGNQGLDFKGVATEGFGWVNASYVFGLQLISVHMRRALGTLTPWETFQKALELEDSHD